LKDRKWGWGRENPRTGVEGVKESQDFRAGGVRGGKGFPETSFKTPRKTTFEKEKNKKQKSLGQKEQND